MFPQISKKRPSVAGPQSQYLNQVAMGQQPMSPGRDTSGTDNQQYFAPQNAFQKQPGYYGGGDQNSYSTRGLGNGQKSGMGIGHTGMSDDQIMFIREMTKKATGGPPFAPLTPKRNDPLNLNQKSAIAGQKQLGGRGGSVDVNSLARSPTTLCNLKIKSSKAFPNEDQRELAKIVAQVQKITAVNMNVDDIRRRKLTNEQEQKKTKGPKASDPVDVKVLKKVVRAQRRLDSKAHETIEVGSSDLGKSMSTNTRNMRSRSTIDPAAASRDLDQTLDLNVSKMSGLCLIRKPKMSLYEKLGLNDPDGSDFQQEKAVQMANPPPLSTVHSYKFLRDQSKTIALQTEIRRDFIRAFAQVQLGSPNAPDNKMDLGKYIGSLKLNNSRTNSTLINKTLAGLENSNRDQSIPAHMKDNYHQMLKCFERPTRRRSEGIFDNVGKPQSLSPVTSAIALASPLKTLMPQTGGRGSTESMGSQDSMTGGSDADSPQKQNPDDLFKHFTYDKLMMVKEQLKTFVEAQMDIAGRLQPHLNFERDNFGRREVYQILSISRNPQTQGLKNMKKNPSKLNARPAHSLKEILGKTEESYITAAYDKLSNHQVSELSDLLLNDQKAPPDNIIKKLEREQLQVKMASGAISSQQTLEKFGLGSSSGASVGGEARLNLAKMAEDVDNHMVSSARLNVGGSTFKLRIDTFENKIRVRRKTHAKADAETTLSPRGDEEDGGASREETQALGHVEFINQDSGHIGGQDQARGRNFQLQAAVSGTMDEHDPRKGQERSTTINSQNKNPFDMFRGNSRLSIQQHVDPELQIPEESYALESQEKDGGHELHSQDIYDPPGSKELLPQGEDSVGSVGDLGLGDNVPGGQFKNSKTAMSIAGPSAAGPGSGALLNMSSEDSSDQPQLHSSLLCVPDIYDQTEQQYLTMEQLFMEGMQPEQDNQKHYKRLVYNLAKLRRVVFPVFSGSIGPDIEHNMDSMKRVFGVSATRVDKNASFFRNTNAKKLVYYAEMVKVYQANRALQEEIERYVATQPGRRGAINSQLIAIMQNQFQSGVYHWMHVTQKMLQETVKRNPHAEITGNLRAKLQKKVSPIIMKSPFVQSQMQLQIEADGAKIVPVLINRQKFLDSCMPSSRQYLGATFLGGRFWIFGGNASKPLCDFRSLDLRRKEWCQEDRFYGECPLAPRYAHSFLGFAERYLVVFGGASQFFQRIKRRESLQDLWVFDTHQPPEGAKWVQVNRQMVLKSKPGGHRASYDETEKVYEAPKEIRRQFCHAARFDKASTFDQSQEIQDYGQPSGRMAHAAAIYGGCLLIHGGYNGQNDEIFQDFVMFDIGLGKWIRCKQPKQNRLEAYISPRQYHSMTLVRDPSIDLAMQNTRIMWIQEPYFLHLNYPSKGKGAPQQKSGAGSPERGTDLYEEDGTQSESRDVFHDSQTYLKVEGQPDAQFGKMAGMYVFGGLDYQKAPQNDLYLVQPHYERNMKYLTHGSSNYKKTSKAHGTMCVRVTKVEAQGGGMAPCPRHSHASTFINTARGPFLVIHGGRNDEIYQHLDNIGLNDLHLFDIKRQMWLSVAIYNRLPSSRWAHQLCLDQQRGDQLIMFGGVNVKRYCDSSLHEISFNAQDLLSFIDQGENMCDQMTATRDSLQKDV